MSLDLRGISFPAWRNDQELVPLVELMLLVGPWTLGDVSWSVLDCEFGTGRRGSARLTQLAQSGERLSTLGLVDLVSDGVQLVDGEATCFLDATGEAFLVLASIRGDSWDLLSAEPGVFDAVRRHFPDGLSLP